MYFKNQKFLVLGVSKSGYSATKVLLNLQAKVYIYDDETDKRLYKDTAELVSLGAVVLDSVSVLDVLKDVDVIVVSPGVAINHNVCIEAKKLKKRIIGELELGFLLIKSPILAVTGTNGKTTVSNLTAGVLKDQGYEFVNNGSGSNVSELGICY